MLLVTAQFNCSPDAAEAFASAAEEVVRDTTEQEPGCISYVCCRVLGDEAGFVFIEQWQDGAALNAHSSSAHFQQFVSATKDIVKDQTIELHVVERTKTL